MPVEEVTGEPLFRERVCGIDIGKAEMYATIRVPSDTNLERRMSETRAFATTRRGVLALADWLRCWQVLAATLSAHELAAFGVDVPAGLGGDLCWRRRSG